ncbi:MAG: aldolase/citrate lyase family protein [Pseudomonadota bacterium]
MVAVENVAKSKLEAGDLVLGVGLRQSRTVDVGKAMKLAGFDWLFIDLEHNSMHIDTASQIAVAALDAGIAPILRVPGFEQHHAARALDGGAQGIVFPHVDDAETAARLASYCRYPPDGRRSMTGALPQLGFATHSTDDVVAAMNDTTLVVMMIESAEAVANAEAIAAVPGVDVLLIGTNDLCIELGIPGQYEHQMVIDAYQSVIAACRKHGKHPAMGGIYKPETAAPYINMGMRMILCGSDLAFMMAGGRAAASGMRAAINS